MRRTLVLFGFATALIVGIAALPVLAAADADVDIPGGLYYPPSLTVEGNAKITWTNHDIVSHSVTSAGGLFDSGPIEQNATFNHTFADTGTYPYGCTFNASTQRTPMQGVVIVVPEGMMVDPGGNVTPGEEPANTTLTDLVAGEGNLTAFAGSVEKARLAKTVLSNDTEVLDALILHHIVRGNHTTEDLTAFASAVGNETVLETLSGDNLTVGTAGGTLTLGNATVVASNITAANGIVHIIDTVLVPPENATPAATPEEPVTP
ncbi:MULTISPECIES: fasciclin domain-containing protein [unclassified Methanoculleus]|jgi:plastocyanin|uniref:Fasciclin domain-containing protein n=2 Tax=Methanoculleus TaxID=45989 RepID=A0ABD8A9C0_9EURY|nr:fasciclin domain-containing protein [Methanoculleus palmolei]